MKKQLLLFFFAISIFFVGCTIEKRHYNSGYHVEWHAQNGKMKKAEAVALPSKSENTMDALQPETQLAEVVIEIPSGVEQSQTAPETAAPQAIVNQELFQPEKPVKSNKQPKLNTPHNNANSTKSITKASESPHQASVQSSAMDMSIKPTAEVDIIVLVILAILLPPLAVYLHSGIGTPFWISVILTLLFWVPGVIYSLLVVLDVI